jgi:hypothetical protein
MCGPTDYVRFAPIATEKADIARNSRTSGGRFPKFCLVASASDLQDRTFGGQFKQARHSERRKHRATTKSGHSQYLEKSVAGFFAIL